MRLSRGGRRRGKEMLVTCVECGSAASAQNACCPECGAAPDAFLGPPLICAECALPFRAAYSQCQNCGAPKDVALGRTGSKSADGLANPSKADRENGSNAHSTIPDLLIGNPPVSAQKEAGGVMTFLRWTYRRVGQIVCFALAGLFLFGSLSAYDNKLELCLGAGILFVVALTLRHQMLRRFYTR